MRAFSIHTVRLGFLVACLWGHGAQAQDCNPAPGNPPYTLQGPNCFCPQPMLPMTNNYQSVLSNINNMVATGNTLIDLGLVWGWRMLSPKWRGVWGGTMAQNSLPLNYNSPKMKKAVILLTDGYNTIDNSFHGAYWKLNQSQLGTTDQTTAVGNLDSRLLQVCTSLKNNGVTVYTIALGNETDPDIINKLTTCATDPGHFYNSPGSSQLQAVFTTIAGQLSNLRVSQ